MCECKPKIDGVALKDRGEETLPDGQSCKQCIHSSTLYGRSGPR